MVGPKPDTEQLQQARLNFASLDADGSFTLSLQEMSSFLRSGNPDLSDRELHGLFRRIDTNGNGKVEFDEFVSFLFTSPAPQKAQKAQKAGKGQRARRLEATAPVPQAPTANQMSRARSQASTGQLCDWCQEPLSHEVTKTSYQRKPDGSMVQVVSTKFVRDGQISLRLPGLQETVTLHEGTTCKEDYIEAHALRCEFCDRPVLDDLVTHENPETGEAIHLHANCEEDYEAAIAQQGADADGLSVTSSASFSNDGWRCAQCRQPFTRTCMRAGGRTAGKRTQVTEAKTTLQLPGMAEAVTLHSDGDCVDRYIQDHALRCEHCHGPVVDELRKLQLPWAENAATLHKGCLNAYSEANATRCSHCKEPIVERGIRLRSGKRMHYLHDYCESNF